MGHRKDHGKMRKGVFALLISFVLGLTWLFVFLKEHPFVYVTKPFQMISRTVELPSNTLPPFLIVTILAVFVNLCAMFASASSVAMGACVLYAAAIGFYPDCYPYVIIEFLLCLVAAVRMREKKEEKTKDLADQIGRKRSESAQGTSYVHHYTDSASFTQEKSSRSYRSKNDAAAREMEAQKRAAAKAMGSGTSAGVSVSSYETLRAQEERNSLHGSNGGKLAAIVIIVIAVTGAAILVPMLMRTGRNQKAAKETVNQPWWMNNLDQSGLITGGTSQDGLGRFITVPGTKSAELDGYWKTENEQTTGSTIGAEIRDGEISIYWINRDGSSSLYWAGKLSDPDKTDGTFSCMAVRNASMPGNSPFASQETTKQFLFSGDTMKFQMTKLRFTAWITLKKTDQPLTEGS